MDISIIVPVYNEEESLKELTIWISKVMKDYRYAYEIIMVDDGSSDHSWNIISEIAQKNSNVKGISFRRNYGKSAALQKGFEMASGEVVITMDADLQDSPDEIPELYKMIKYDGYDMVSGWKKKRRDPIHKRWPSKLYNRTVRMFSGIKLHDFNCGLKAYRCDVIKSIEVYGEMHRYIPVIAKWAGFTKIGEKVIHHYPRKFGKSKFGVERYFKGYLDLLTISFISRYGRRPMHFFGLMGTFLFLAGFVIAFYLAYQRFVNHVYAMTSRPLFYFGLLAMILGTILFVGGFLGELISRNNPDRNKYILKKNHGFAKNISSPNQMKPQRETTFVEKTVSTKSAAKEQPPKEQRASKKKKSSPEIATERANPDSQKKQNPAAQKSEAVKTEPQKNETQKRQHNAAAKRGGQKTESNQQQNVEPSKKEEPKSENQRNPAPRGRKKKTDGNKLDEQ